MMIYTYTHYIFTYIYIKRERDVFFLHQKKECISRIRNGELRRARWQAAKASGRKSGGRADGAWCFARHVAEQPQRGSARELGAGSAPGPAFYFGPFRGLERYRKQKACV